MKNYLPFLILFISASCNVKYKTVKTVLDGDTIVMEDNTHVRFNLIDAPESKQAYGYEAKVFVSNLILNKRVKLVTHGNDKYGRTIADIYIDGIYVNEEEVKAGLCWAYKKYSSNKFYQEEQEAKIKRIGLWIQDRPEPPYLFRKLNNHFKK